jgi:hypothetical protein
MTIFVPTAFNGYIDTENLGKARFESDDPVIISSLNIVHEDTRGVAYFLGNLNNYADGPEGTQSQHSSIKVTWEGVGINPPWKKLYIIGLGEEFGDSDRSANTDSNPAGQLSSL